MKKVLWLYENNHLKHPFIRLAAESLAAAGHRVAVLDRAVQPQKLPYRHVAVGCLVEPGKDFAAWRRRFLDSCRFWLRCAVWAVRCRPEIVIGTLPAGTFIGWAAGALFGARRVYYPFELFGEQHHSKTGLWTSLERKLIVPLAESIITQNNERAAVYQRERGARVPPVVVANYKARRNISATGKLRAAAGLSADVKIVLYEGQLVDGRWLPELIEAVTRLPEDVRLVLLGKAPKWWRQNVKHLLASEAARARVVVLPEVSQEELFSLIGDADVGVIIYDDRVRNNFYCAPGKLSDYVQAGVPVVVPNFPTVGPLVRWHGIGEAFARGRPEDIARAIRAVLARPKSFWAPALGRAAEGMVWETQEPAFLRAVLDSTDSRAREDLPTIEIAERAGKVLHIVPDSVLQPRYRFHGSTKDVRARTEYFQERRVPFIELPVTRRDDLIKQAADRVGLAQFSTVIFDVPGSFPTALRHLRRCAPKARLIFRSHNAEFLHRLDWMKSAAGMASRAEYARRALYGLVSDFRTAAVCDEVHCIADADVAYWRRLSLRAAVHCVPFFLSADYDDHSMEEKRLECTCVTAIQMTPMILDAARTFSRLVKGLGPTDWSFSVTGMPSELEFMPASVRRVGLLDSPHEVLRGARAVAVLSDLGRGFKTKILEAIEAKARVLLTPTLFERMPEEVRDWCLPVDKDSPDSFRSALDECRRPFPATAPNEALRRRAFAELDRALGVAPRPEASAQEPARGSAVFSV